jgi:hypothetical protein
MNYLNFNQSIGFPLETDVLDQMQKNYNILNAFGAIVGNFSIISGCVTTGTTVSNGIVFINGEVFEFKGGTVQDNVVIVQTVESLEFEDFNSREVIFTRYVTFGIATTQFPWSDFKPGFETKNIPAVLAQKAENTTVNALIARIEALEAKPSNVPVGLIAIWGRPLSDIPAGWEEYINLRGRFPMGLNPDDPELASLGSPGGNKTKKLSIAELPIVSPINGSYLKKGGTPGGTTGLTVNDAASGDFNAGELIKPFGGDVPFSLLNPFRIVHYIIKT